MAAVVEDQPVVPRNLTGSAFAPPVLPESYSDFQL